MEDSYSCHRVSQRLLVQGTNVLFPSFKLRSFERAFSSSDSGWEHGDELVNQCLDTDACLAPTSVRVLLYCLSPSSRGAVSDLAVQVGSWVRANVEKRRIRPLVICVDRDMRP
jgi:hypothetical protein